MKKPFLTLLVLIVTLGLYVPLSDANPDYYRPLAEEPVPLSIDPNQFIFVVRIVPTECSRITDTTVQCVEVWECPAGRFGENRLSDSAVNRLFVPYNIAVVKAAASRGSHCDYLRTEYTAAAVPVPTPGPVVVIPPSAPVPFPAFTG